MQDKKGRVELPQPPVGQLFLKWRPSNKEPVIYYKRYIDGGYIEKSCWTRDPIDALQYCLQFCKMSPEEYRSYRKDKPTASTATVKDVYKEYMKEEVPANAPSTRKEKAQMFRHLLNEIGNLIFKDVTTEIAENALSSVQKKLEFGFRRRNRFRATLHVLFEYGIRKGLTEKRNPITGTKRFNEPPKRKGFKLPGDQYFEKLFKAARSIAEDDTTHLALLGTAFYAGLRASEIIAIELDGVEIENKLLRFFSFKRNQFLTTIIHDELIPIYRLHVSRLPANTKWLFPSKVNPSNHISYPRTHLNFIHNIAGIPMKAGEKWHVHRHKFITDKLSKGVAPAQIAEFTGQSEDIIRNNYNWVGQNKDALIKAMNK